MKTFTTLCWLILSSPANDFDKVFTIWELYTCEQREATCAIIIYETGWMQAYKLKVDNAQKHNNLPGFRYDKKYLEFNSYYSSIKYYKKWQKRKWHIYHKKYPDKNYYDFLKWVHYCDRMDNYIKVIKTIEKDGAKIYLNKNNL